MHSDYLDWHKNKREEEVKYNAHSREAGDLSEQGRIANTHATNVTIE